MKKKARAKLLFTCVILVLTLVILFSGLQILESAALFTEQTGTRTPSKTIVRDGKKYFPRQDITTVLLMGIDEYGEVRAFEPNKAGGVDMVAIVILDEQSQSARILSLNRDTMMSIRKLDENGKPVGSFVGQLTYSHMYGTGLEDSCENTRKVISDFLYGINIDYYMAMNMDAISILNDAVGGVTVNVTYDFSDIDPKITMGEMTLRGDQAITFVQSRKRIGDQLNTSRMERQQIYMEAFMKALRAKMESSDSFALKAYADVSPYIVTDISSNVFSSMVQHYSDYSIAEMVIPEGENVMGEQYMEFHVDKEKLDDVILRLFYAEK